MASEARLEMQSETHEVSTWLQANGIHGRLSTGVDHPISLIVCIHGGGCSGRYFDLPSFSFRQMAVEAGHAVLMVDRPGHGASPSRNVENPVYAAAGMIPELVRSARETIGDKGLPVAAFGHSIGGAVALHWAAQDTETLKYVVTSGVGARPTEAALAWHHSLGAGDDVLLPNDFFFGPEGSFDWRAPIALRRSGEVWAKDEVEEILLRWPDQYSDVTSRITCPTLCILSENERIWETGEAELASMRASFAPGIARVELAAGGGHLYEVHRNWSAHAGRIIAFVEGHI